MPPAHIDPRFSSFTGTRAKPRLGRRVLPPGPHACSFFPPPKLFYPLAAAARCSPSLAAAGLGGFGAGAFAADPDKLRIGFQKSSTLTIFLKSRGMLEKTLAPLRRQRAVA